MVTNHYSQGTLEYKQKQKVIEAQTKGFVDVQTVKEAKELIRFAYTREGIPLRYTQMGTTVRVLFA